MTFLSHRTSHGEPETRGPGRGAGGQRLHCFSVTDKRPIPETKELIPGLEGAPVIRAGQSLPHSPGGGHLHSRPVCPVIWGVGTGQCHLMHQRGSTPAHGLPTHRPRHAAPNGSSGSEPFSFGGPVQNHPGAACRSRGPANTTDWEQRSETALKTQRVYLDGWGQTQGTGGGWGGRRRMGVLTVERQEGTPMGGGAAFTRRALSSPGSLGSQTL